MDFYKEDDSSDLTLSKELNSEIETESWNEVFIFSIKTQISLFLSNPHMFSLLSETIKILQTKLYECQSFPSELSESMQLFLQTMVDNEDFVNNSEPGTAFFSFLGELTKYESGLSFLRDIDIIGYLSMIFSNNKLMKIISSILQFMTEFVKNSGKETLIDIYERVPFLETIGKWINFLQTDDATLLNFFEISIISDIPIETLHIILLMIHIIISGFHVSNNNSLSILQILHKILLHHLLEEILPDIISENLQTFFLSLFENIKSDDEKSIEILNENLFCSALFLEIVKYHEFAPFLHFSVSCFKKNPILCKNSIFCIMSILQTYEEGLPLFLSEYQDFLVLLNQNLSDTFKCNIKESISELFLFILLHSQENGLIAMMIETNTFFPFILDSLNFETHQIVSILALEKAYSLMGDNFPLFETSQFYNENNLIINQIMDYIEDLSDSENVVLSSIASDFLSNFHKENT